MCIISQHLAFEQRFGVVADFIYQAWSLPGASLQEKRTFLNMSIPCNTDICNTAKT